MARDSFVSNVLGHTGAGYNTPVSPFYRSYVLSYKNTNNIADDEGLGGLLAVMVYPNLFEAFLQMFRDVNDMISSIIWYPFEIPSYANPLALEIGDIILNGTSIGTAPGHKVVCLEPFFTDYTGGETVRAKLIQLGTIHIDRYFNNYLDYEGYTSIQAFLPYLGFVDLPVNEVMDKTIEFRLGIDWYTGKGTYYVTVGDRLIGTYTAQIGYNLPLTRSDANEKIRNLVLGGVKAAAVLAGAAVASKSASPEVTTTTETIQHGDKSSITSSPKGVKKSTYVSASEDTITTKSVRQPSKHISPYVIPSVVESSLGTAFNSQIKTSCDRYSDPLSLAYASKVVKIIIKRPKPKTIDSSYNYLFGKPAGYTEQLANLSGFTKVNEVHLTNFTRATDLELKTIKEQLISGIII